MHLVLNDFEMNDFASGTDTVQPAVPCGMLIDQKPPGTQSFLLHV